jgi:hypothetical protein
MKYLNFFLKKKKKTKKRKEKVKVKVKVDSLFFASSTPVTINVFLYIQPNVLLISICPYQNQRENARKRK